MAEHELEVALQDLTAQETDRGHYQAAFEAFADAVDGARHLAAAGGSGSDDVLPRAAGRERVRIQEGRRDHPRLRPVVARPLPDATGETGALGDIGPRCAERMHGK
jgi:hypothetical protein